MPGRVDFETSKRGVATVTLSHSGKLNAMSRDMWRQLRTVFTSLQSAGDVRCIVIRGEGGQFCAGGDISEYADFRFEESTLRAFHEDDVWGGLQAMLDCDVPIVAQLEGNCMGAGVEIACCCDIRIADAAARFGAPIARLGFPMAPHEIELVLREAGALSLREMLLQAAVLDATVMLQRGFLNCVAPHGQCVQAVTDAAQNIADLAPKAARMNKQLIRAFYIENRASSPVGYKNLALNKIAFELKNAYAYANDDEHREGVAAFLEKRKPDFLKCNDPN